MSKEIAEFGQIRPNAELRKAVDKLEMLREAYDKYNFVDFLKSINVHFLDGEGKIEGPNSYVRTDVREDESVEKKHGLDLEGIKPGVSTSLTWQDGDSEKEISVSLELVRSKDEDYNTFNSLS